MAIPQLVLGAFNLTDWAGVAYGTSVIAEGTSRGAPVPIEVAVKSWLQDGSIVVTQGYDNRTVTLRVKLRAPSLTAVSTAEAALFGELGKPNTLTWTPASGPATVFVVVTSSMEESPGEAGDLAEAQTFPWRTYNLRLVCEAFTRSAAEVVTSALAGGGTTTNNVDTMGATTGWTATINGVGASVVNAVGPPTINSVTQSTITGLITIEMTKTLSVTTSSLKYLIVDWQTNHGASQDFGLSAVGDGTPLTKVAEAASPLTAGYTRSWFFVSASSLGVLKLDWISTTDSSASRVLRLDNIAISDVKPGIGSARQQLRTVAVAGSAPTQGALAVESATAALGDALVYVFPSDETTSGYVPALRQFRTAGNTVTTDANQMSGSVESITTPGITYQVPVSQLPSGLYVLLARMATSGGGTPTITWTTRTVLGGTNLTPTVTGSRQITTTTAYQIFTLARFSLPTMDLGDSSPAVQSLNLLASSTCTIDEAWLFNTSSGQLIQVACGTGAGAVGGAARRLFIEPATTTTPRPSVRIGHSADRSDAYAPSTLLAWQRPQFHPSVVNVFTATSNATDAAVTLRHYPRWHTNAAS